jgi:biofilm PGA synthesis protein PgaD
MAWTFWVSLWLPVITLIAWLLGLQDTYVKLGLIHPLHGAGDLGLILLIGLLCALAFGSWSMYNHLRFVGKQKRRGNRHIDVIDVAKVMGASIDTATHLQSNRRSVVYFTQDGYMSLASVA